MKVATAAYPLDWFDTWDAYVRKLTAWVAEAAGEGADLLVFPEYGAMELATLAGGNVAADLQMASRAVSDLIPQVDALHVELAALYGVHILAASAPVWDGHLVNRARLITPDGKIGVQDKQIMTRGERDPWDVRGGGPLQVFETSLGKIGVLICYDSEFPLFSRALVDADVILVPSCTEAEAGYTRVRIGAQATALMNQCVTVMSSIVGEVDWNEAMAVNTGKGGVFGPPDQGFPANGVMGEGKMGKVGWTYADVDLEAIAHVRADGGVLNASHWDEQTGRDVATPVALS